MSTKTIAVDFRVYDLGTVAPLSEEDSEVFLEIIAENRPGEKWNQAWRHENVQGLALISY